jgi:putative aldouronate transport system permease protein
VSKEIIGKKATKVKKITSDTMFDAVNWIYMIFTFLIFAWPIWFIIVASFSDPNQVNSGNVWLWPVDFHLGGYKLVFENKDILIGYRNSIFYTVFGTLLNMVMTVCAAYPLSRMTFVPRKFLTVMFVFTMYFSGGMVPIFLQVRDLHLVNTPWAMIIPSAVSIFNVLLLRSFFMYGVPKSLEEAAQLDGASTLQVLLKVYLPLVKPTLAVLVLYYAVGHWNDYFSALLYVNDRKLLPLQYVLREILIAGKVDMSVTGMNTEAVMQKLKIAGTMKYSVIIVSTLPLMLVYPFIQKHFVKGIMIGAVKG